MPLRVFFLLCCVLIGGGMARGAEPAPIPMLAHNWNTKDGLPQDHVNTIVRTRDGFLWLATDAGLARFDGATFKTFGLREGLGSITVLALLEARDGTLWIGTQGGYVSALRGGRIERTYSRDRLLVSGWTMSLAEDASGRIWVAGQTGLAWLEQDRLVPVPGAPHAETDTVRNLYCDRQGVMWVSFRSLGTARWQKGQWNEADPGGPQGIRAFCEDPAGRLWAGDAKRQIWCREEKGWRSYPVPVSSSENLSSMAAGPDGTIWIAFYGAGVVGWRNGQFLAPTTRGEQFLDLAELVFAPSGERLWVGTTTKGLYLLTPRHVDFESVEEDVASKGANFISALLESAPGEFLVGTQGKGLYRWGADKKEPVEEPPELTDKLDVNAAVRTRDGSVWIASTKGLVQFRDDHRIPQNVANTIPGTNVWDLCEDHQGNLWVGKSNGELYRLQPTGAQKIPYGGGSDPIKGLAAEADGTLWIGTRGNGLFRLRGSDGHRFGTEDGLPSEIIRVVYVAPDGALWVGMAGGGLAVRKGERFHAITTQEGLPDDTISQLITDDKGRLWVGTSRGLAVFSVPEVKRIQAGPPGILHPLIITHVDGLLSEEFTITPPVKCHDGRLAFATTQGLALLEAGDFQSGENAPPVFIDRVLANGRPVDWQGKPLSLPAGVDRLEFIFTGLSFSAPERLRFRTRLVGLDADWGEAGSQRTVEYRNLAPGTYRLEVAATAGNGLWSPQPAALEVTLAPHFWQTAWFQAMLVLAGAGFIALAVYAFERQRVRRRMQALERQQALDAERSRIARDLHDDIGSTLTQVALLSELAQGDLKEAPDRASEHINEIFNTANSVTRALDEIVWAVNPSHDTIEGFTQFFGTFVQNYARAAGLQLRLDLPAVIPPTPLASPVRHHLYLAAKEILHNVVKHAGAGEIRVRFALEPGRLRIVIADDGCGFDPARPVTPGSDGLLNLQRRLEQLGGTCTRQSAPGTGTTVELMVPLVAA